MENALNGQEPEQLLDQHTEPLIEPDPAAQEGKRTPEELETYKLHRRFDRMGRLVGDAQMQKLLRSHVMVIGLGGVGSWAAESLVRSGVGKITLVDFDEVCITNFNRQLHALQGTVGKKKVEVMGERLLKINPALQLEVKPVFYYKDHVEQVFGAKNKNGSTPNQALGSEANDVPNYVIDAIDSVTSKCHLIHYCKTHHIPIVTCTGSGGKLDPTQVRVTDLAKTQYDPLARSVRKILRDQYGFPQEGDFGVKSVYSDEKPSAPEALTYDKGKGFQCVCPQGQNEYFQCDNRNVILGNASFVTGAFGLACASVVVRDLMNKS